MARIVLGVGTSHTPMLYTDPEDWPRYEARDRKMELLDGNGAPIRFDDLAGMAGEEVRAALQPAALESAYRSCQTHLDRLADAIAESNPDVVIVIGDDQNELFHAENLPAIAIYWGDSITNKKREPKTGEPEWWSRALSQYYGREGDESCPVDAGLARHLIDELVANDFDIAQSKALPEGMGEGHAFAFVHSRLLKRRLIPVVPVFLNTYYPPNQPTPRRCYRLGQQIGRAVESFDSDARVLVIASGGLSHFVVQPSFDRAVLDALTTGDTETLISLDRRKLDSGTSEIRNWIAMYGASEHLSADWSAYIPAYRTRAGTGTGCGFGVWR